MEQFVSIPKPTLWDKKSLSWKMPDNSGARQLQTGRKGAENPRISPESARTSLLARMALSLSRPAFPDTGPLQGCGDPFSSVLGVDADING